MKEEEIGGDGGVREEWRHLYNPNPNPNPNPVGKRLMVLYQHNIQSI